MANDPERISEAEAKRRIERLENLDTIALNIDELREKVDTRGLLNEAVAIDKETTIYRARILKEKPARVSDLSYPPIDSTGLNRANRKHDPVFYASSGAGAAVFELDPDIGDKVAILKWRPTEEIMLNTIGYSSEVLERLDSSREPRNIPGDGLADAESQGNLMMRTYLAELFTKHVPENEKYHHKLTAAIAEIWRSGESLDGVMYPTVRMWANEDNIAIETEVVDRALKPVSGEFIEIQGKESKKIETEVLDTCTTIQNGEIQWNGHGRRWEINNNGTYSFVAEDGRWKLQDSTGGEAPPLHDPDFLY